MTIPTFQLSMFRFWHVLIPVTLCQSTLSRLQLVQNAAIRLLTVTRESITRILASLHWLPVKYRVDFKVLLFVFKALQRLAPGYISDLFARINHSNSAAFRSDDFTGPTLPNKI